MPLAADKGRAKQCVVCSLVLFSDVDAPVMLEHDPPNCTGPGAITHCACVSDSLDPSCILPLARCRPRSVLDGPRVPCYKAACASLRGCEVCLGLL